MDALTFEAWPLPNPVRDALSRQGIVTPSEIQKQAIPLLLAGKDILGLVQNGCGKRLAFCLPLISLLDQEENRDKVGLILAPTPQLATQIAEVIKRLTAKMTGRWKPVLVIDEANAGFQEENLRKRPRLIVATPKRLSDHLASGIARLDNVKFVIMEEADQLLDQGEALGEIFSHIPPQRQTMLFCSNPSKDIKTFSEVFLQNPIQLEIAPQKLPELAPISNQDQDESGKFDALLKEIEKRPGNIIVFSRTKFRARRLAQRLFKSGHPTDCIHSDRSMNQKQNTVKAFQEGQFRVLVATDIAIGSIEIPNVAHVINYDIQTLPGALNERADSAQGQLFCLTPKDDGDWLEVQKILAEGGQARSLEIQKQKAQARENGEPSEFSRKKKLKNNHNKKKPRHERPLPSAPASTPNYGDEDDDSQIFFQPSVEEQLNQLDTIIKRKVRNQDPELQRQIQHARAAEKREYSGDNRSSVPNGNRRKKRPNGPNRGNRGNGNGNTFYP